MTSPAGILVFSLVYLALARVGEGKTWALLTAGSNTWDNYRHQADICHAYQILHKHGIQNDNIVVMMYDDIAYNEENPTRGKIINKPSGPDVYQGVPKDYTRDEVTPNNFVNVLKGDKHAMKGIGSGKVIDSGPNDDVFVYFSDHGAPGILAFPGVAPALKKKQLIDALKFMHQKKKYRKLVLYIEACESGSMVDNALPANMKIFSTTAANPMESSYACYWDKKRETYLGDLYSVAWMENSDKANLTVETLQEQFRKVKRRTNTSHVQEYGDMQISSDPLIDYQGEGPGYWKPAKDTTEYPVDDAVPSPEVPMEILKHRFESATSLREKLEIHEKIKMLKVQHQKIRDTVYKIAEKATFTDEQKSWATAATYGKVSNLNCHEKVVEAFEQKCYQMGKVEAALRYVYVLANLCELKSIPLPRILAAIDASC